MRHFKIQNILIFLIILAIGLKLFRHAWESWGTGEIATLALLVLSVSASVAWFRPPHRRSFWIGFGLMGLTYLALATALPIGSDLPTAWFLETLYDRIDPISVHPGGYVDFGESLPLREDKLARFLFAGQSLFSLVFALLGGIFARTLFPGRHANREQPAPREGSLLEPHWRESFEQDP